MAADLVDFLSKIVPWRLRSGWMLGGTEYDRSATSAGKREDGSAAAARSTPCMAETATAVPAVRLRKLRLFIMCDRLLFRGALPLDRKAGAGVSDTCRGIQSVAIARDFGASLSATVA
jgi:hypothetical protein